MIEREEIKNRTIELLGTMCQAGEIREQDELIYDLGISSVDIMILCARIEEEFKIKIDEPKFRNVLTVEDLINMIHQEINA